MGFKPQRGTVHEYASRLTAFEFDHGDKESPNAIIFIGGLGDGLLTVPYVPTINEKSLPDGWSIFQIHMSSSYIGWGTGSLDRDIKEIGLLVKYLRTKLNKKKVILFGHSTGCQDSIHYLLNRGSDIDGIVLQAPVSDREAMVMGFEEAGKSLTEFNHEARYVYEKHGPDALLPKKFSKEFFGAPINAYRWISLSEAGGDDDYFSSDLADSQLKETFGKIDKPLLVLYSGSDEFVPPKINKEAVVERYKSFTDPKYWSKYGGIVKGAAHNVGPQSEPGAVDILVEKVKGFLSEFY